MYSDPWESFLKFTRIKLFGKHLLGMQTDLAKHEVGWFVGCEENLVDASLQSDSYVCLGTCELKYVNTHKSQFLEF